MIGNSATEKPLTYTIKSNLNCQTVAWNSHNQLACGYDDGTFEIHEMESRNGQLKSRMVQKIRHDLGDSGQVNYTFSFKVDIQLKLRAAVSSLARNEKLNLLASGGTDGQVKVFKQNVFYLLDFSSRWKIIIGQRFRI